MTLLSKLRGYDLIVDYDYQQKFNQDTCGDLSMSEASHVTNDCLEDFDEYVQRRKKL